MVDVHVCVGATVFEKMPMSDGPMSTVRWADVAVAQAEAADKALSKAVDEATATTYKADQLKEPKLLGKLDDAIRKAKALKGIPEDQPGEWLAWQLASARKANATDADEANVSFVK